MRFQVVRVKIEIPKLWVTGFYKLSDSKIMKIFKTDSKGNFSINITGIEVEAIINVLRAVFMQADPKSTKRQSSCQSFLRFWYLRSQKLFVEH
jgi:hypothetical protein